MGSIPGPEAPMCRDQWSPCTTAPEPGGRDSWARALEPETLTPEPCSQSPRMWPLSPALGPGDVTPEPALEPGGQDSWAVL